jgi:hypothetical protein
MTTSDMLKPILLTLVLGLGACSSVEYRPNTPRQNDSRVRVLMEYPHEQQYQSLGMVKASHYQLGFRVPTVLDVMPKLMAKAAAIGGNAVIVRSQHGGKSDRTISVIAEVLAVEPSVQK